MEERRNRADLIEVYKAINSPSSPINKLFEIDVNSVTRGHKLKLRKHLCKLDTRKYFFAERVISRWNKLDNDVIEQKTLNGFKNGLEKIRMRQMGFFKDT